MVSSLHNNVLRLSLKLVKASRAGTASLRFKPNTVPIGLVSAGEFVKHRGTEITEEATADFSVSSVSLCFSFHHFIQHPPELHDLIGLSFARVSGANASGACRASKPAANAVIMHLVG